MTSILLPSTLADELQIMLNSFSWGNSLNPRKGIKWSNWDKLCIRKEKGGMGFRNFHLFNLAMLGKIGWNCFSNPDTLLSRVFKAKYYLRGDFLNAQLGQSPSYAWRSIYSSHDIVKRGIYWQVGSGALGMSSYCMSILSKQMCIAFYILFLVLELLLIVIFGIMVKMVCTLLDRRIN